MTVAELIELLQQENPEAKVGGIIIDNYRGESMHGAVEGVDELASIRAEIQIRMVV